MKRALLGFALGAAAFGFAITFAAPAGAAPPDTIRVASAGDDNAAPLLYADKAGLFRKAGLDVQISKMNSGSAVAVAIAGGALEIGKSSLTGLIAAHLRGVDFALVAPSGLYVKEHPIGALVVATDSTIQTARDFVGKTISASALNDINVVAARAWLEQQGVDPATVHFIELPESAVSAALVQHRIDASTVLNPVLAGLVNSGKARVVAPRRKRGRDRGRGCDEVAEAQRIAVIAVAVGIRHHERAAPARLCRRIAEFRQQFDRYDDGVRAAIGEDVGIVAGWEERVDGNRHDAGFYRAEKCDRKIDRVEQREDDTPFGFDAESAQRARGFIHPRGEFAVRERAALVDERRPLRARRQMTIDQIRRSVIPLHRWSRCPLDAVGLPAL